MTPVVQAVTNFLSLGTIASDLLVLCLFVILLTPLDVTGWGKKVIKFFGNYAILLSFLVALGSVVGSLFYSEYAHFAPCELCWIQRGLLYTQAVILFLALFARKEENVRKFHAWTQKACLDPLGDRISDRGLPYVPPTRRRRDRPLLRGRPKLFIRLFPPVRLCDHPHDVTHRVRAHTGIHASAKTHHCRLIGAAHGYTNSISTISDFVPSRKGGPQVPTPLEVNTCMASSRFRP